MATAGGSGRPKRPVTSTLLLSFALACSDASETPDDPQPGVNPSGGSGGAPSPHPHSGSGGVGPSSPPSPRPAEDSPEIVVWYGSEQVIGGPERGAPQRFVNVLGHIDEPTASAGSYRVNDGPDISFPFGPSTTRLMEPGDFNLEVDRASLSPVPAVNTVDITVERGAGDPLFRRVTLHVYPGAARPTGDFVDWTSLGDIDEVNQAGAVVDGLWHLTDDGIRTSEYGYDRLLALGSQDWTGHYEVLAEFIVHHIRSWGAVGLAVGWQGHEGEQDPREEWPLEALGWVRNAVPQPELQLMTYGRGVLARRDFEIELEVRYSLRMRTERTADGPWASLSIWPTSSAEPADWLLSAQAPEHDGSVLLVTHHADVTWAQVRVTPLD